MPTRTGSNLILQFDERALHSAVSSIHENGYSSLSHRPPSRRRTARGSGWGTMGHEAVAYVATDFVALGTKLYFQDLLGDNSSDYLASVAAWADSYRHTRSGRFSAPFHYINANDSPPSSCGVNLSRDCGSEGCIVSAIANYV